MQHVWHVTPMMHAKLLGALSWSFAVSREINQLNPEVLPFAQGGAGWKASVFSGMVLRTESDAKLQADINN